MLDKPPPPGPIYNQLVNHFRDEIYQGKLGPGDRLPAEIEIASEKGVSRGTVRQALNILFNEGLIERVAGRGTFVRPVTPEKELRLNNGSRKVGLVLSHPALQLSIDILLGVEQAAKPRGYEVSIAYTGNSPEQQATDLGWLKTREVGGIILFLVDNPKADETLQQLRAENFPIVLIDRYLPDLPADFVGADNQGGARRATEHLLFLGHKRVGFAYSNLAGLQTTSVRDRWKGYRKAFEEYNLIFDENLVIPDLPLPVPPGPNEFDLIVQNPKRPGAIFAVNDSIALGLIQAAQRQGVRIPEDLAIVGFDDLNFAPFLIPPLTTVAQPRKEIGIRAANLLINRIEGQGGPVQQIELMTSLVVRTSCGARLHLTRSQSGSSSIRQA